MLRHCLVGALSAFLVQAGEESTNTSETTPAPAAAHELEHAKSTTAASTRAAPPGEPLRFLGRTWCFGSQDDEPRCDITLPRWSAAPTRDADAKPQPDANEEFAWRLELLGRRVCLGAVSEREPCDVRLRAEDARVAAKPSAGRDTAT
ncbi:MAG: hypothetical protein H6713_39325 [Myxococcales bacterium]|nr:hypothetical protein [Myxococcales bacterium]